MHSSVSETGGLDAPETPWTGEDSSPPAKIRKVESDPETTEDGDESDSEHTKSHCDSHLASSPCTCHCGGCCCHGTSPEPQHCVRCHTNYRLNHPEACAVPHVHTDPNNYGWDELHGAVSIPSVCCGVDAMVGDPREGRWDQPFPCFVGWHTTNVETVEEQYNGINVLRCDLGPGGKCLRTPMKHPIHFEILYDEKVQHVPVDKGDCERFLERKRGQLNDDELFKETFTIEDDLEEEEDEGVKEKDMRLREAITKRAETATGLKRRGRY